MAKTSGPPPFNGLKKRIAERRAAAFGGSGGPFVRQTYRMHRDDARAMAQEWFDTYPKAAYWTTVETWRELEGDEIEFTMRRLPSAD